MDALTTIVETCRKLGLQAGDYIGKSLRGLLDQAERLPGRILAAAASSVEAGST